MKKLPRARNKNLVMQDLEKEVLLYDLETDRLFCLNETLAIVYRACNGEMTPTELIRRYGFTEDLIRFSLHELQKEKLIDGQYTDYLGSLSRREVVRRIGMTCLAALPVITGLTAPQAAAAQSGSCIGQLCTFDNFTQSDCCNSNFRCSSSIVPNACQSCFASGERFAFAAPAADTAFCNGLSSKNLCCNSGSATGDGSWCYCP